MMLPKNAASWTSYQEQKSSSRNASTECFMGRSQHLNFRSVEGRRNQILIFDCRATGVADSCWWSVVGRRENAGRTAQGKIYFSGEKYMKRSGAAP